MKSPIKTLIIPSWYPTNEAPLAGIFFKEQSNELSRKVQIAVFHIDEPIKIFEFYKFFQKNFSVTLENNILLVYIRYVNWIPYCNVIKDFFYHRAVIKGYSIIQKQFGTPDIIHAHSTLMGGYGAIIIGKKFNIPVVVSEHVNYFNTFFSGAKKHLAKKVLQEANYYTSVSSYLQKLVNKEGRIQCETVPNFIPQNKFVKTAHETKKKEGFTFLNISTQVYYKGIDVLLKAFYWIVTYKHVYNIHLDIIGEGPDKNKYLTLMKELDLEHYCTFHGEKKPDELNHFFQQTDALIISSREETFGIVGIEAMSVGIPIVSTKCGGPEDYITEETGILVENENPHKLGEGILYMINTYENYSPSQIRQYFLNNYSSDILIERWIKIYQDLIENKFLTH